MYVLRADKTINFIIQFFSYNATGKCFFFLFSFTLFLILIFSNYYYIVLMYSLSGDE